MLDLNTKNAIETYLKLREECQSIYHDLKPVVLERTLDILEWENKNIGTDWDVRRPNVKYSYDVDFAKDGVNVKASISWSYGGYNEESYFVPYDKLLSDSWKEKELLSYNEKQKKDEADVGDTDKEKLRQVKHLLEKMCNEYDSDFDKTLGECLSILSESEIEL